MEQGNYFIIFIEMSNFDFMTNQFHWFFLKCESIRNKIKFEVCAERQRFDDNDISITSAFSELTVGNFRRILINDA